MILDPVPRSASPTHRGGARRGALLVALLLAGLALVSTACGDDGNEGAEVVGSTGRGYVVATTGIWADVVSMVACNDQLDVRTVMPPGVDPHAYEPSLRDREVLDDARLVVANGLDLEETLADTLDAVDDEVAMFQMADHIPTLTVNGGEGAERTDPHVWFDPIRVREALPALADALVEAGADRVAIDDCLTTAEERLTALDDDIAATLASVPEDRRILVTNHDALGYFADRYGLEILGSVLPSTSTLTAASPADLEELGAAIEATGVPAVFTETFAVSDDVEALADDLGVEVVELYTDALGEPGSGADTYEAMLRTDARAVAAALGS